MSGEQRPKSPGQWIAEIERGKRCRKVLVVFAVVQVALVAAVVALLVGGCDG